MKEVQEIISHIKNGKVQSIYVLDGEEPYYIDLITHVFEQDFLPIQDKDFNQSVFYGKDAEWSSVVNECRSYPAFAAKRLVILKEAAQMKDFAKLESYMQSPSETTILVIAHKYKKVDGRSSILKAIKKNGYYATFDKLRDYQVADWISKYCSENKFTISSLNSALLANYLGNDLQKIVNEIQKVAINLKDQEEINEDLIEKYIGISKDYNIFQFPTALLERNAEKAFKIANYFMANPKEAPLVVVTATLYGQFSKLYQYHFVKNLPDKDIAAQLKISPYFVKDFKSAAQTFNLTQTAEAIHLIHAYNLNAIGMNVSNNSISLLKELTTRILQL
jgi:DNA polymerase-3 subunit delta